MDDQIGYVEIRRLSKLLFEYDPDRDLVRIKLRGRDEPIVVDLREYWTAGRFENANRPGHREMVKEI
ncbi:MAG: hypothetical protein R6X32_06030 [Chloroflexota bacterium]